MYNYYFSLKLNNAHTYHHFFTLVAKYVYTVYFMNLKTENTAF